MENYFYFHRSFIFYKRTQIFRVMKIGLILLLVSMGTIYASAYSQKREITLNATNISIKDVIKQIEKQSDYTFFYNEDYIDLSQVVSLTANKKDIAVVLNSLCSLANLNCKFMENNLVVITSESQQKQQKILGKVTDQNGQPIVGVTVSIKGTSKAVITDANGNFSIGITGKSTTLVFTFIGFISQEHQINGESNINIMLIPAVNSLDEVVVIGYGTQKKANITGAVTTVKMDQILGNRPVSTTSSLMQGVVPGLQVTVGSGQPGASSSINLRGATDISTGSNTMSSGAPLILVDNVPFNGPLNMIDPNDIETLNVLKDAGSAAIYGSRSAFGVILITTKKGSKNQKAQFTYSNNFSYVSPTNLPEKATPLQAVQSMVDMGTTAYWTGQNVPTWMQLMNDYIKNPGNYPLGYAMVNGIRYQLAKTDVIKDLLSNVVQQTHNFAVSGGSDKSFYRFSLGTVDNPGIIAPSTGQDYYKRYNIKSVISSDVTSWLTTQLDVSYYNSQQSTPYYDAFGQAANLPSFTPVKDTININGTSMPFGTPKNLVALSAPVTNRFDDIRLTGRTILKPLKGLTVTGEYTFDNLRELYTSYDKQYTYCEPSTFHSQVGGTSTYKIQNYLTDYHALNIFANYQKSIGNHNFTLMTGFNQEDNSYQTDYVQKTLMISDNLPSISQATGIITGNDNYSAYSTQGYFGRLGYDYMNKYLLQVNGRYDGSSNFPDNHRWGFFPSFSAGWRVTEENFMKSIKSWLNEFKLRGSFGSVGNQNVGPYQFVPGMASSNPAWLNGGVQVTTLNPPALVSSSFTWESVQTLDFGADIGLLKNRLTGTFDWYRRDTKNMLYNGVQLPAELGAGAPLQNVAALRSTGYEIQLNWQDKIGKVNYHINVNLYDYQSIITKIKNQAGLLSQYYVGQKMGEIWGYVTDRLYTTDDFVAGSLNSSLTGGTLKPGVTKLQGSNPNPGDVMYKDLNGDGIITPGASTLSDPGDRKIIGNSTLRYQYGISGGISWKNFDFNFVLKGVGKSDIWLNSVNNVLAFPNQYGFGTIYSNELNYWTPTNLNSFYGRIYDQANGNQKFNQYIQTKYLLNGAYLKVENLSISYTFESSLLKKIHINRLQIFYSIENPFMFTHLPKGLDPETVVSPQDQYGLSYPYLKKSSIGVNVSF